MGAPGVPGALTDICIAKRLLRVHRGAAAGVGGAQQRAQQQEAERQPREAGRGAHGRRAGDAETRGPGLPLPGHPGVRAGPRKLCPGGGGEERAPLERAGRVRATRGEARREDRARERANRDRVLRCCLPRPVRRGRGQSRLL